MTKFLFALQSRWFEIRDGERGATAVEYGIMVALIAVVIIAAVYLIGQRLNTSFTDVKDCLTTASTC